MPLRKRPGCRRGCRGCGSPRPGPDSGSGKKGLLKQILRNLGGLTPEERPLFGARANVVKEKVAALDEAKSRLGSPAKQGAANSSATEDLTLPGLMPERGSRHPVRLVMARMSRILPVSALKWRMVLRSKMSGTTLRV